MIRYALACDQGHEFESWFPSGASYDAQAGKGLVTCPVCGSAKVDKRLMAPALARAEAKPARDAEPTAAPTPEPPSPTPQAVALLSQQEAAMRAMLRAVREHVTRNADNVGERFPEEARRMHYGDIEHRSIYGRADAEEADALREEGIEVHPLPILPDDRN